MELARLKWKKNSHKRIQNVCDTIFHWWNSLGHCGKNFIFQICVCRYHDVRDAHLSICVTFSFFFFKNVNDTHECRQKREHENSYTFPNTNAREFTQTKWKFFATILSNKQLKLKFMLLENRNYLFEPAEKGKFIKMSCDGSMNCTYP